MTYNPWEKLADAIGRRQDAQETETESLATRLSGLESLVARLGGAEEIVRRHEENKIEEAMLKKDRAAMEQRQNYRFQVNNLKVLTLGVIGTFVLGFIGLIKDLI